MRHIIKFSDDSVIVSLLTSDDPEHGAILNYFTEWCKFSVININVAETKGDVLSSNMIGGRAVDVAQQYKYLGYMITNDKLTFEPNVAYVLLTQSTSTRMFY